MSALPAADRAPVVEATQAAAIDAFHLGMIIAAVLLALGGLAGLRRSATPSRAGRRPPTARAASSRGCRVGGRARPGTGWRGGRARPALVLNTRGMSELDATDPEPTRPGCRSTGRLTSPGWSRRQARQRHRPGPRDAPVLLFIHGHSACWQHWLEQLPHFAATHRCVALDLPGFGRSPIDARSRWSGTRGRSTPSARARDRRGLRRRQLDGRLRRRRAGDLASRSASSGSCSSPRRG